MNAKNVELSRAQKNIALNDENTGNSVSIWWLGQAGFLFRFGDKNIVIDPYLSDALAEKYKGKTYPHIRMMPPPLPMEELKPLHLYLSTHAHSDHLDPGLIPIVVKNNPDCRFILPKAVGSIAAERGVPKSSMVGTDAGETLNPLDGLTIHPIPAAHEELKTDETGRNLYLGYIICIGDLVIYHSGDCLPYPGMRDWLSDFDIDLALMPVNGRKADLSANGIAGNFDFAQARSIIEDQDVPYMIPHHFGMFNFNTVDPMDLEREIREHGLGDRVFPAESGIRYSLKKV